MHCWGDEWFNQHGDSLYMAIEAVEKRIRKWAKAGVCGKEKWGCYRDDFLTFWDGGIAQIFFGYRATYQRNPISRIMWKIDHALIPVKKTEFGWYKVGLANFNRWIGLTNLVNKWQANMVNKAFQVTCREYPDVVDELVSDTDCYEMIKPCKWGDIDGVEIHRKYWKSVE